MTPPSRCSAGHSSRTSSLSGTLADHLAMHHGRRRVDRIVAALGEPGPHQRALAIELLEVLAGRETGERMVALLDPHPGRGDLTAALDEDAAPDWSAAEWVIDLAVDPEARWGDSWLRACAIQAAPAVLGASAADLVRPWVDDTDPVVAETARWAVRDRRGTLPARVDPDRPAW